MEPFTPIVELAEVHLESVDNTSRTDDPVTTERHLAYQTSEELVDFPTDDEGIVRLRDVKIKSLVPLRLASITSHQREDQNSSQSVNRGPISFPTHAGSVWGQVEAALEEEGEEFLEKVHKSSHENCVVTKHVTLVYRKAEI